MADSATADGSLLVETVAEQGIAAGAMAAESPGAEPTVEELDESPLLDSIFVDALEIRAVPSEPGRSPAINKPMMSGMSLSLIAHVALLGLLFMITYKLPRESASLSSEVVSVTAVMENFEAGQPLDMPQPVELELPEPSPVASEAQPTALAEITAPSLDAAAEALAGPQASSGSALPALAMAGATGDRGRSGGAASGGGGTGAPKIGGKFFGVGAGGNFFCYVVDSSGSMRGEAWQSAKEELLRSLRSLSARQRFLIVFFAKEIAAIPEPGERVPAQRGLLADPQNIDHARRWIDSIKLDRGGPPNDALAWAIDREPDAIYLLTDGVTKTDVCGFLRKKNRISDLISGEQVRVPVHTIAYHSLEGQQLLRQLAAENAGQFHYVPKP
jgi:hypothetical protein